MTSYLCTEEETVHRRGRTSTRKSYKHCVEAHLQQSHTLKWQTDTHMATAVAIGAVPTLTSVADLSALAGAVASPKSTLSVVTKRSSSQTRYLKSMTGFDLHIWPNGSVSGVRSNNYSSKDYGMLEFITILINISSWMNPSDDTERKVEIRGVESKMWLCMDKDGALYGSKTKKSECEFHENYPKGAEWGTYYSVQHPDSTDKTVKWYIALNRRGRVRKAMTSKHKSSKFKTTATRSRDDSPDLPDHEKEKIKASRKKTKTYKRTGHDESKENRQTKKRDYKPTRRPSRRESLLSEMLGSMEKAVAAPPTSKDSDPTIFHNSMRIDLGENNPFENIANGDKIRHRKNKVRPKSKRQRKQKTYRRKDNTKS